MPLPRTARIEARATEVYAILIQHVLKLQTIQSSSQASNEVDILHSHFPYLRQLLTCCACGGVLEQAMVSSACDHHYCCKCQFSEPLWKITCRQCKERAGLIPSPKMQALVDCYLCMCRIVDSFYSSILCNPASPTPDAFDPVLDLLKECSTEGYKCSPKIFKLNPPKDFFVKETIAPVGNMSSSDKGTTVSKGDPFEFTEEDVVTPKRTQHTLAKK